VAEATPGTGRFKAAHAAGDDWAGAVKACLNALGGPPEGANLGFLYATDALADDMSSILTFLREKTRIEHWVGSVGFGVAGCGTEYHDRPAIAVLVAALPEQDFRVFRPVTAGTEEGGLNAFRSDHGPWLAGREATFGVAHGDPRNADIARILDDVAAEASAFLVGGLTGSRREFPQVAGAVAEGGLSGVLFAPDLPVAVGLTQGCTPISAPRAITAAESNVIMEIDGRPALEVFKEDIGELLARDLRRVGGYIFAAFPIAGSDTGDYLVRNLTGLDPQNGWIAVADLVEPGQRLMFCRRDHDSALQDLKRMLRELKGRAGPAPKAGIYVSCVARGQNLFGPNSEELALIEQEIGEIPLAGFFANGEISNNRLYGYTGVLALFL
jgi:small ligand-binding sensory domain FIST